MKQVLSVRFFDDLPITADGPLTRVVGDCHEAAGADGGGHAYDACAATPTAGAATAAEREGFDRAGLGHEVSASVWVGASMRRRRSFLNAYRQPMSWGGCGPPRAIYEVS
jgi:hypothetical protein